jgi:exonuclease III
MEVMFSETSNNNTEDLALVNETSDGSLEDNLLDQNNICFNFNNNKNNNSQKNLSNLITFNELNNTQLGSNDLTRCNKMLENLKITHWNCNSVRNKITDITEYLQNENVDILCLNEVRIQNEIFLNHLLADLKYTYTAKIRKKNSGGGVAILVKDGIEYEELKLENFEEEEVICIKIRIDNKMSLHIISYYKAPDDKINESLFKYVDKNFKNYIIAGDLNAHLTNYGAEKNNETGDILNNILFETNSIIVNNPHEKTYHKMREVAGQDELELYEQTLDYVLCSPSIANKLQKCQINKLCDLRSDHFPIEISINIKMNLSDQTETQSSRVLYNFDRADWEAFTDTVHDFAIQHEYKDSDHKLEIHQTIVESLNKGVEVHVPTIKLNKNGKLKLPPHILALKRERNKYQDKYRKCKQSSQEMRTKYYKIQAEYLNSIYQFKSQQWQKFLNGMQGKLLTSKPFWQKIGRARNKRKPSSIPTLIHPVTKEELVNDADKAQFFGNKLSKTFNNTDEDYNKTFDDEHKNHIKNWYQEFKSNQEHYDEPINEITYDELKKAINSLNNKTSVDMDNISNMMLKKSPIIIKELLVKLFNLMIRDQVLPDQYKLAIVTMIPKAGQSNNPNNYRPISVTSAIMRLFEKVLLNRVWDHLKKNKIILDAQSGFRSHRQTKDNLMYVCQKTLEKFNYNKKTCAIFYDIASAFDKVWHEGLIYKIDKYKFPSYLTRILDNYLNDRCFKVRINDQVTNNLDIKCGVPQGGVLSPILFSIYINDLPINKNNDETSLLFADDLVEMFIVDRVDEETSNYINKHLKDLETWLNKWRLKMAPHKCAYLIFSKNKKSGYKENLELELYGTKINKATENNVKFLGIRFDKHFSFKNQIEHLKHTCNERINILKVISHKSWKLDKITLLNTYKLLVRSIIDYSLYLYDIFSATNKKMLQTIQNKCLRIIFKEISENSSIQEIHEIAKIESISERAITIKENYLLSNVRTQNPIVFKMLKEYKEFETLTSWRRHPTLLDSSNLDELELNTLFGDFELYEEDSESQSSENLQSG